MENVDDKSSYSYTESRTFFKQKIGSLNCHKTIDVKNLNNSRLFEVLPVIYDESIFCSFFRILFWLAYLFLFPEVNESERVG